MLHMTNYQLFSNMSTTDVMLQNSGFLAGCIVGAYFVNKYFPKNTLRNKYKSKIDKFCDKDAFTDDDAHKIIKYATIVCSGLICGFIGKHYSFVTIPIGIWITVKSLNEMK